MLALQRKIPYNDFIKKIFLRKAARWFSFWGSILFLPEKREDGTRNTHSKDLANAIRIEDALPAIIDRDLFDIVQKRMAQNKRQQGGRPATKREYPLRSKVFCAECKSAMTISTSRKEYYYYRCTGKNDECEGAWR